MFKGKIFWKLSKSSKFFTHKNSSYMVLKTRTNEHYIRLGLKRKTTSSIKECFQLEPIIRDHCKIIRRKSKKKLKIIKFFVNKIWYNIIQERLNKKSKILFTKHWWMLYTYDSKVYKRFNVWVNSVCTSYCCLTGWK